MGLLEDTHVWYIISFLAFLGILWKFGREPFLRMLDSRIDDIKKELETAENLRVEAQEMLAQYQRKHRDAMQDAEQIIEHARQSAQQNQKEAETRLKETIRRREEQLKERIARMEQAAIHEIQAYATELSMNAATEIIAEKLDKKTNESLVDQAIKDVGSNIH